MLSTADIVELLRHQLPTAAVTPERASWRKFSTVIESDKTPSTPPTAIKDLPKDFMKLPITYQSRITTNLPFENWTEVLGSERLTQRVHILETNGESYRLKDAKARLKRR